MNIFKLLTVYNRFVFAANLIKLDILSNFLRKTCFLLKYYSLNELIWQEGLMVDFLQKKIADNWIRKFLIYSANLFNERLIFDKIIKFYLDLIIWPLHKIFIFEFDNVSWILFINLFIFLISFLLFSFFYFFLLFF